METDGRSFKPDLESTLVRVIIYLVVQSADKKIVFEFYRPMVALRRKISERLGLKVEDRFNAAWDFIVNG